MNDSDSAPFWTYGDLLLLLGLVFPLAVVEGLLVKGAEALFHFGPGSRLMPLMAGQVLLYAMLFAFASILFRWRYGKPFWRSAGFVRPQVRFRTTILLGQLTAIAISALGALLKVGDWSKEPEDLLAGSTTFFVYAIVSTTVGPICEEAIFRGLAQPLLVRSLGIVLGILIPAAFYGFMMMPQYAWDWRYGLLVGLASATWGWARYKTGSSTASSLIHAAYNATYCFGMLALKVGAVRPAH